MGIIGELGVVPQGLSVKTGSICDPNETVEHGPLVLTTCIGICDSLRMTCSYTIDRYQKIFQEIPTSEEKRDLMLVLENIMKIDNIAVRFLMQYEVLLNLLTSKRTQKEVTAYIRDVYNPTLTMNQIAFHPTRRAGKDFEEDDITYYRNILAHNDSRDLPKELDRIITQMSLAANRVIFYKLHVHHD